MGIRRLQSRSRANAARIRLPITFSILSGIKKVWEDTGVDHDRLLMWAAATVCFFGFFCSGEITVPSAAAFDPTIHLSWGDVAVDDLANPSVIRFFLKRSKCDQFGSGVEVFVGKTGKPVHPVTAVLAYLSSRRGAPGPFFKDFHGETADEVCLYGRSGALLQAWVCKPTNLPATASGSAQPQQQPRLHWKIL